MAHHDNGVHSEPSTTKLIGLKGRRANESVEVGETKCFGRFGTAGLSAEIARGNRRDWEPLGGMKAFDAFQ
jgi:hypothetical protein